MNAAQPFTSPPRAACPLDGPVIALALVVVAAAGVAPASAIASALGSLAVLCLAVAGSSRRLGRDARALAWIGLGSGLTLVVALPRVWPLVQLVTLLPALVAVSASRDLRGGLAWIRWGRLELAPIVAIGGVAALALPMWVALASPELSGLRGMIPPWPLGLLALALLGFASVNAALEELLFRGLLQGALDSRLGPGGLALGLQSALFGLCHWSGFPSGPSGVLLAGVWAVMLGWARRRSGGLLTPLLAHVVADAVIFALLITSS